MFRICKGPNLKLSNIASVNWLKIQFLMAWTQKKRQILNLLVIKKIKKV